MNRISCIHDQITASKFDLNAFALWVEAVIAAKETVVLEPLEINYFEKILLSAEVDNYTKFFLLKTLHQIKVKVGRELQLINHHQNIRQLINVEKLSDLASYQQILKIEQLITELSWQDPTLNKLSLTIWNNLFAVYFPLTINIEDQLLAEAIVGYVNKLLVPNQVDNNKLFSWIEQILKKLSNL